MLGVSLLVQLGESDCETIGDGILRQPVNGVSSLAFTVVGVLIAMSAMRAEGQERAIRVVFGILMGFAGIGSFLFHGPQTTGSHFLHDITFLATIWFLVVMNGNGAYGWWRGRGWAAWGVGTVAMALILAVFPNATNYATAALVVALVVTDVAIQRRGGIRGAWYAVAVGALVVAVGLMVAGNTSSPLCDPDSPLQAHGGWHVFVAIAIGSYFMAMSEVRSGSRRSEVTAR